MASFYELFFKSIKQSRKTLPINLDYVYQFFFCFICVSYFLLFQSCVIGNIIVYFSMLHQQWLCVLFFFIFFKRCFLLSFSHFRKDQYQHQSRKEKKKNNKTTKSLCLCGLCTVYYQLKRKEKTFKKSFPKKNNPSRVIVLCLFVVHVHVHVRLYVCVYACVCMLGNYN